MATPDKYISRISGAVAELQPIGNILYGARIDLLNKHAEEEHDQLYADAFLCHRAVRAQEAGRLFHADHIAVLSQSLMCSAFSIYSPIKRR